MTSRLCLLSLVLTLAGLSSAASAAAPSLAGTWKIDLTRGSELSPWKAYELTIAVEGNTVTIDRQLGWGRRQFRDRLVLDTTRRENVVPVAMWPDNRHIGAYIGGDKTKRVHAFWLDDQRILRLSSDLVLDTQQGARAVNILSDYKVSANGAQLTLTELRSSRNLPVVYVFTRASAPSAATPSP